MKFPYCIGWHPVDSQKRTYYEALFDERSDAESIARDMQRTDPAHVFFVDVATEVKDCPHCKGTGNDPDDNEECAYCHGKGRVRK